MEEQNKKSNKLPFSYDIVSILLTALVVIMVVFTFVFRFVGVVGNSMYPTLQANDWLLVRAVNNHYEQGDIIISSQPNAFNEPIVKRVIAVGGQKVDIDFEKGIVYVDGEALEESYISEPTTTSFDVQFPIVVPEGELFVLGDNRNDSTDSRSTAVGTLDERYIIGKVMFRILPFDQFSYFE